MDPGLCASCVHAKVMRSDRGSEFWRCLLAEVDGRFVKYPRLPVSSCEGFSNRPERVNSDTENVAEKS